ncbi:trypco2 family protein [Micromonospora sp. NPDC126480]|uniref:trypco2 family protein n=1 Tax=Micromonospora sp. NPDC126480 TaxID=3155312 RepID=UPI00332BF695
MQKIGLADAITALREELTTAIEAAGAEDLRFRVGEMSVEFEIAVERTSGGRGGLKFWVVEAGGEHTRTGSHTHRITVPLTPTRADGRPVLTGEHRLPD